MNCIFVNKMPTNDCGYVLDFRQRSGNRLANAIGHNLIIKREWHGTAKYHFSEMNTIASYLRNPASVFGDMTSKDSQRLYEFHDYALKIQKNIHSHLIDHQITITSANDHRIIGYAFSPYVTHIENAERKIRVVMENAIYIFSDRTKTEIDGYEMYILDGNDNLYYPETALTVLFLRKEYPLKQTMPLNIYLGGSCSADSEKDKTRTRMTRIAEHLRGLGFVKSVYCPFELKVDKKDKNGNWKLKKEVWAKKVFDEDIRAIDDCSVFLMISTGRESTAGVNFEQGYAYAKGKFIGVVQINDKETSLMTFCGNDIFTSISTEEELFEKIDSILTAYVKGDMPKEKLCKTVLT